MGLDLDLFDGHTHNRVDGTSNKRNIKKRAPATIADAAAILFADSETERREIRKTIKEIYAIRSAAVHGNFTYDDTGFDNYLAALRNVMIKLITTV